MKRNNGQRVRPRSKPPVQKGAGQPTEVAYHQPFSTFQKVLEGYEWLRVGNPCCQSVKNCSAGPTGLEGLSTGSCVSPMAFHWSVSAGIWNSRGS